MDQVDRLNDIFSTLNPVGISGRDGEAHRHQKAPFKLSVLAEEPFLKIAEGVDPVRLSPGGRQLFEELRRLENNDGFFADEWKVETPRGVSLHEMPYLVHMMKSADSVEGPEGGMVTFEYSASVTVLKVVAVDDRPDAAAFLCLRADGMELKDLTLVDDTHILAGDTIYEVKSVGPNYASVHRLLTSVPKDTVETYLSLLLSYISNVSLEFNGIPAAKGAVAERSIPTLFLEKVAPDKALYMRTGATVESITGTLPPGVMPTCSVTIDEDGRPTVRDVAGCDIEGVTAQLETLILSSSPDRTARKEVYRDGNFFIIPEATAGPFLLNSLPQVLETFRLVGSEKLKEYKVVAAQPRLKLKLSSGIDFLEGEGTVTIGEEQFGIADILAQYAKKRYVSLSDGNRGIIDEKYIGRLQRLYRRRDKEGRIRVNLFDLPEVEELIQSRLTGEFARSSRAVLSGFNKLRKARTPGYKVDATLRPYQNEGVKWMKYLYDNKLGGCLADDMGLGKTLQTIALLSMLYPGEREASLIVMPRSLLFNWEKELERFCPAIRRHTYYGPDRNLEEALKADVVLTTYALMRNDAMKLKDYKFHCIILDESQSIKNYSSQTTMAVQLLQSDHRIALSGTPMENNLTELYSLFRFLNPTMFGTIEDFNSSYTTPIQKYGDKDASASLRRRIFPFIMRRLKKDVLDDLPPRIDQTLYVEMSPEQARLYNERRLAFKAQIKEAIAREGVQKSQFMMFQALGELRRIASIPETVSGGRVTSPKIEELVESLAVAVGNGHKTVVFFNFIAGLENVFERLERMGVKAETMTGSTSVAERKRVVERFQNDPDCMVMLLTLKVGGLGLNLTAADMVYIFEPWWNKAAEEQAIDRLHRIGQKSTVNSFSLITVGTIEEKILQLQEQKKELFNDLISADTTSSKHLSEKDIDFILS